MMAEDDRLKPYPRTAGALINVNVDLISAKTYLSQVEHPWDSDWRLIEAHKKIREAQFWIQQFREDK